VNPRELSFVQKALASMDQGGYAEALARVGFLLAHGDEPLPLSRLQLAHELIEEYRDFLPDLPPDQVRRIGGEQEIIARYEPDKAIESLPALVANGKDRDRLLLLLDRVLADRRVQRIQPSPQQSAMLVRLRAALDAGARPTRRVRGTPAGRPAGTAGDGGRTQSAEAPIPLRTRGTRAVSERRRAARG
jgi:hypothetical protein